MRTLVINRSPLDEEFRRVVADFLNSARKEVVIVAGELGSLRYSELELALGRAVKRRVAIKVCLARPHPGILNKLILCGCEVFCGEKLPKRHFMVVDRRSWTGLEEHPPSSVGTRCGKAYIDDPDGASKKLQEAEEYFSTAKKVEEPKWEDDPAIEHLRSPLDWDVVTDCKKLAREWLA